MPAKQPEEEFLRELRAAFKVEAREHLQGIEAGLVALGGASAVAQSPLIEKVFRAAHSLKGAARAVDLRAVEARCQALEEIFSEWRRLARTPSSGALDRAHRALDALAAELRAVFPDASATTAADGGDTVRVPVSKLDERLEQAEELLAAKLAAGRRSDEIEQLGAWLETWRRRWQLVDARASTVRHALGGAGGAGPPDRPAVDRDLAGFLDWNLEHVRGLEAMVAAMSRTARRDGHTVGQLVDELLRESKKLLLLPFATITGPLPRIVRDLCREQGKDADLEIRGGEVEIDRRILEEIKDGLIHLVRNSVDHGVETPAVRAAAGKPARASIVLEIAALEGGRVSVALADDGCGIDSAKVKAAAIAGGIVDDREAGELSADEAIDLVFRTGLTTRPEVTPLSGRGLGLAIVREKAELLSGSVSVRSTAGQGTRILLDLPAMKATFRGVLVEAAGSPMVVPGTHVERVIRVQRSEVRTVEGREVVSYRDRTIPLVALAQVLESSGAPPASAASFPVVVLGIGDQRVGFVVDAVVDEVEGILKQLNAPLVRVRNVAGATVLASGQLVPILHAGDLLRSARKAAGFRVAHAIPPPAAAKTVLVAEDSITSRMLLKGILESAGFQVKTAVDGAEAFAMLRMHRFDILVSDVDMPRLNGFGLTAKIRGDARLAELPVVLVTTLDNVEDRERGIDAGANAYIVKSRFDQSDLLDAVRRLL